MCNKLLIVGLLFIAYLGNAQAVQGTFLSRWHVDTLPSSSNHDNRYNEVWGIVHNGTEYGIIGSTMGTHFIDVSDPINIKEVAFVKGKAQGTQIVHRDFHDFRGYLYAVCDEGSLSSLQIIDYSYLPDSVHVVYDSRELIRRSHNIFIDSSKAMLYALYTADAAGDFKPMKIFDISDPIHPVFVNSYSEIEGSSLLNGGVHDAFVQNDTAFLNVGYNGFLMVDFSDKQKPRILAKLGHDDYPFAGYNHSGWPSKDLKYYYMADEDHGFDLKVIDLNNLPGADVVNTFDAEAESPYSIPHNQIVKGDRLYCSYYFDGLQVWDISNRAEPKRIMYYPTSSRVTTNGKYQGAWGVYPLLPSGNILVSDMQEGLFVIKDMENTSTEITINPTNGINIFPTLCSESFRLIGENANQVKDVRLYNLSGVLVRSYLQTSDYNLIGIPQGHYFVEAEMEQGVISLGRLVKK